MGVDERPYETPGAFAFDRQLFGEEGLAGRLPFLTAKNGGVGSDVCDVDAVRSSIPPLKDAAVGSGGTVYVVWYIS